MRYSLILIKKDSMKQEKHNIQKEFSVLMTIFLSFILLLPLIHYCEIEQVG